MYSSFPWGLLETVALFKFLLFTRGLISFKMKNYLLEILDKVLPNSVYIFVAH